MRGRQRKMLCNHGNVKIRIRIFLFNIGADPRGKAVLRPLLPRIVRKLCYDAIQLYSDLRNGAAVQQRFDR